jgi:hypothetical protein
VIKYKKALLPKIKITSLMTREQKLKIRTELAHVLMRYSNVKNHLESFTGELESSESNGSNNDAEKKFKDEIVSCVYN